MSKCQRVRLNQSPTRGNDRASYREERQRTLRTTVLPDSLPREPEDADVGARFTNGLGADRLVDRPDLDNRPEFVRRIGAGRPRGSYNRLPQALKHAILLAAEEHGEDDKGKDGLKGYLRHLARTDTGAFASLLKRILPVQIKADASLAVEVLQSIRGHQQSTLNGARLIDHKPRDDVEDVP